MKITKAQLKQLIKEELDDNRNEYIISTIHEYLQDIHDSLSRNRIQLKPEELVDFVQKALESFNLKTSSRMS
tara:strand:- start:293 stop:508 length:216 start_codon:yes stop_codon:yes gene_type:complete